MVNGGWVGLVLGKTGFSLEGMGGVRGVGLWCVSRSVWLGASSVLVVGCGRLVVCKGGEGEFGFVGAGEV